MAKTKKQKLIDKMDKLWSEIIRSIGYCECCKTDRQLEAHHLIPRGNHLFRFDLHNGICLCVSCHKYGSACSAHGRAGSSMSAADNFMTWFKSHKPEQYKWYLQNKDKKMNATLRLAYYEEQMEYLAENDTPDF